MPKFYHENNEICEKIKIPDLNTQALWNPGVACMRKKFSRLVAFASESSGAKAIIVVGGRNNVVEVEILKVQANKWESAILK